MLDTIENDAGQDLAAKIRSEAKSGTPGGIKSLMQGRADMFRINPYDLHIKEGWNFRDFDEPDEQAALLELAESIAARGVNTPLKVYVENDLVYVSAGHRRRADTLIAIERLGAEIRSVPCIMGPRGETEPDRVLEQLTTNTGKPPSQLQVAGIFSKLLRFGWTEQEIGRQAGMSVQKVRQTLDLQALPEAVKAMVQSGEVSANMARETVKRVGEAAGEAQLSEAVAVAKATGAPRAMPKHVGAVTPMKRLAGILGQCEVIPSPCGGYVAATMIPAADWDVIRELLKL